MNLRISFRNLPSMSALFLDYVNDWNRVRNFYARNFSLEAVVSFARQRAPLDPAHRQILSSALAAQQKHWGGDVNAVEKLDAGAVAVISGQQAGLFTGPNYTILKAITIIKLAKILTEAGVPAVPVFWIAAEDHDYQEIEWATILDRDSALREFRVNLSNDESIPSGWLCLKEDVSE